MNNLDNLHMQQNYIDRPPRIQPPLPSQVIEIPPPPEKKKGQQGLVRVLLPLLSIVGYSLVSTFGGGRNILFMLPMALSVIASTSYAFYSMLTERKRIQEVTQAYTERLRIMRAEMESFHQEQRLYYEHTYPQIDTVYSIGHGLVESRMGQRLWERRANDIDFAVLRLGIGDIPSQVIYNFNMQGSMEEDPQNGEAYQLAEDSQIITGSPVTISLHPTEESSKNFFAGRHSMGISGKTLEVMDVARVFMMQLAAFHSPNDLNIYIMGTPEAQSRWSWAQWLPHANTNNDYEGNRMCFEPPLSDDEDPKKTVRVFPRRFLNQINKELQQRRIILDEKDQEDQADSSKEHFILLVIDNLANDESIQTTEWLDSIISEAAIASIMQDGIALNAAIMFLVPHNAKIPSDCQAVYEVKVFREHYTFRYSEVGLNTPRYVGIADHITADRAESFAKAIRDKQIRQAYGADLQNSVSLLDILNTRDIDKLNILQLWEHSKLAGKNNADWLRVAIGLRSGNDVHEIYFHQDYDGVHGMIAGTTGSGKSEMLLTLIAGLAINYDPSILNFVLVDYKGGSAFEPFRSLPHCVDIVTNLDGKAVDRMFVAIDSELKRRSKILADYNVKHIVEYREKGYHLDNPFPHLFIVVDEFAEMINENKEYKARFDSITRLGRAIGVNLILATQRPSGVVTDQMRANMKLRICLRVETGDDSRELLGSSDAMFLPSGIPGRAYLQVGKETPQLIQIARAGGEYRSPNQYQEQPDIIFNATKSNTTSEESPTIVDLVVDKIINLAATYSTPQHKPWPDPLPDILPLNHPVDATHLVTSRKKTHNKIVLHPMLRAWMLQLEKQDANAQERIQQWKNSQLIQWQGTDNQASTGYAPLQAPIGLIDIPDAAQQYIFTLDLTVGPIVIFGAGGWGKTTFLKTLLISLAATHSPDDLWLYIMDFARGGLEDLSALPHMERPIDVTETARVERLLRILANTLDERSSKIREYGSFLQYNASNPQATIPAIVVVIDNFAEFKETYERELDQLTTFIRDGRALGIYFVITADQINAVPSKIYSLFTQRIALKMPEAPDYQAIVGRSTNILTEVQGRGLISVDRQPREFHTGVITQSIENAPDKFTGDFGQYYRMLAQHMQQAWTHPVSVPEVKALGYFIDLQQLDYTHPPQAAISVPYGIRDMDRKTAWLELITHCQVIAPPLSGKTTLLHNITLAISQRYTPDDVSVILIDPRRSLFDYRLLDAQVKYSLSNLPHVLQTVSETEEAQRLIQYLDVEFNPTLQNHIKAESEKLGLSHVFLEKNPLNRHLVIIIDNYDDIADLECPALLEKIALLARKHRDRIHLIIAQTPTNTKDTLIKRVEAARYAIVLNAIDTVKNMGVKGLYTLKDSDLALGRGFAVRSGQAALVQVAKLGNQTPNTTYTQALDIFINQQMDSHPPAKWYFQGSESLLQASLKNESQSPAYKAEAIEIPIRDEIAEIYNRMVGTPQPQKED